MEREGEIPRSYGRYFAMGMSGCVLILDGWEEKKATCIDCVGGKACQVGYGIVDRGAGRRASSPVCEGLRVEREGPCYDTIESLGTC